MDIEEKKAAIEAILFAAGREVKVNEIMSSLEIGEELNIEPRLRPAKTGSVSQNTSKPIKPRKNNKKFATLMSPTTSSVA